MSIRKLACLTEKLRASWRIVSLIRTIRAPGVDRGAVVKIVELKIAARHHLGQHDDLSGVHRNGKRKLKRFPFLCLQTC